jgi:hypothetical protein
VVSGIFLLFGEIFSVSVLRDIEFATYDRLHFKGTFLVLGIHPVLICLCNELEGAEHVAMVSDGKPGHIILYGFFVQGINACRTIEEGILGMDMKVRESAHDTAGPVTTDNKVRDFGADLVRLFFHSIWLLHSDTRG